VIDDILDVTQTSKLGRAPQGCRPRSDYPAVIGLENLAPKLGG
jgi:hypothetical protein